MKKTLKGVLIAISSITIVMIVVTISIFWNELRSLGSLKQVDDFGMFQMTYYGDYGFDEFLEVGATSDSDIEAFVAKRLLRGLPIDLGITGAGCTAFITENEKGEVIYARNFDFSYSPSLQVLTNPTNGYASISTVNLSFSGYSQENLPSGLNFNSFLTLAAPFLPFDGMNEKGVAIALIAVPEVQLTNDADKVTLNTTTAIRLVLDKAADVDEAIALLKNYNIYFSGDIDCHYLLADATGKSVIVEFWDGELQTVETTKDYQIASNFIAYQDLNIGEGADEFIRYDAVETVIKQNNGMLTETQAIQLLSEVGVYDSKTREDKLQWSVMYNLTTLDGKIFAHRNVNNQISFNLS